MVDYSEQPSTKQLEVTKQRTSVKSLRKDIGKVTFSQKSSEKEKEDDAPNPIVELNEKLKNMKEERLNDMKELYRTKDDFHSFNDQLKELDKWKDELVTKALPKIKK